MAMLCCTKVLRPGLPRIGGLGNQIQFRRTIPLPTFLGMVGGGIIGGVFGIIVIAFLIDAITGGLVGAVMGALIGGMIVDWEPWRGEHLGRVAAVKAGGLLRSKTVTVCPGSLRLPVRDSATGEWLCCHCSLINDKPAEYGLMKKHEWVRREFVGQVEVPSLRTGVVQVVSGHTPNPRYRTRK